MSNVNVIPSQRFVLEAVIDPDILTIGTHDSGWVSLALSHNLLASILAGTFESGATLDAKLQQATDSGGSGVKDIVGKAITQMLVSDKQALINCRGEELDVDGEFTHVRLRITIAVDTVDGVGLVHTMDGRYQPTAEVASVVETITN